MRAFKDCYTTFSKKKKKFRKSDYDGHRATISTFKRLRLEYYHELEASQRGMMEPVSKPASDSY